MIARFHMDEYKNYLTKYLSHGQQKKVSLIRSSISVAKIWVIDEPYSALDKEAVSILDNCIVEHVKHDGVVIMTNHEAIDNISVKVSNIKIEYDYNFNNLNGRDQILLNKFGTFIKLYS